MTTIYLATAGEYSDYRVLRAFSSREAATAYPLGDDVEEYELHTEPIEVRTWHTLVWWPDRPDSDGRPGCEAPNPYISSDHKDYSPTKKTGHRWSTVRARCLFVEGWDLTHVRKVYSEQRAQEIVRRDQQEAG